MLSAIALSRVFEIFLRDDSPAPTAGKGAKTAAGTAEEASDTAAADASADAKVFSSYTVYTLYSIVNEYTERTRG